MRLHTLTLHPLQIPFKTRFKHSSAERTMTQSVLVAARTDSGCLGLGEGCPCPKESEREEDLDG